MSSVIENTEREIERGASKMKRKLISKLKIIVSPSGMPPKKARGIAMIQRIILGKE